MRLFTLLKTAAMDWMNDRAPELGAALAFYMIFAMAPLVLLLIVIAGAVFGEQAVQGELVGQIEHLVGRSGAEVVQTLVANAARPAGGIIGTIVGIVLAIVGATGILAQLKTSLNRVWDVEPKPGRAIRDLIRTRLLSLGLILLVAVLLMASVVLSAVLSGVQERLGRWAAVPGWALRLLNEMGTVAMMTLLFAAVFKWLPDVRIRWRDVWVGAFVTAVLFVIGRYLIGLYLGRSAPGSVYGAAGSLVVVLIWLYYSAQIILFGAEVTQVYASMYGEGIQPSAYAVRPPWARKPALRGEAAAA